MFIYQANTQHAVLAVVSTSVLIIFVGGKKVVKENLEQEEKLLIFNCKKRLYNLLKSLLFKDHYWQEKLYKIKRDNSLKIKITLKLVKDGFKDFIIEIFLFSKFLKSKNHYDLFINEEFIWIFIILFLKK